MPPVTVAVVGGTGKIGKHLVKSLLLPPNRPARVGRVIFFTRDPSSTSAKDLIDLGAEAIQFAGDAIAVEALKGVDVLLNTTAATIPHEVDNNYAKTAVEAGVKVYFPTGYGIDQRLSSIKREGFTARYDGAEQIRKLSGGRLRVICVSPGAFMEWWISPFLGIDTKNGVYEAWGDPNVKISGTSEQNVGQSLAELAILAANDPNSVPNDIHIAGDTKSYNEIAEIMSKESGEPIKAIGGDWAAIKKGIDEKSTPGSHHFEYIRLVFSEGAADFSKINDNELFNPGEKVFMWRTIADVARETKGKPEPERSIG